MRFDRAFHDYKLWIQNRAEEIAQEKYGTEFDDLPKDRQSEVYNKAEENYREAYADSIDATYEAIRDKSLES